MQKWQVFLPFLHMLFLINRKKENEFVHKAKKMIALKRRTFLFFGSIKWRNLMFQKREKGLKKKIFVILVSCLCALFVGAGVCAQKQTLASADTGAYSNAEGSNLTYTQELDGGISVTMQAGDDTTPSPDMLIYGKTFAVTDEITA